MPGTMFTEVVSSRGSSSRKWYTVPLSLIVHAAIFAVIIVAPLVATGELPVPGRLMPSYVIANVVPSPPPAAPQHRPAPRTAPAVNTHVAPLEAPPTIGAERGIVVDEAMIQTDWLSTILSGTRPDRRGRRAAAAGDDYPTRTCTAGRRDQTTDTNQGCAADLPSHCEKRITGPGPGHHRSHHRHRRESRERQGHSLDSSARRGCSGGGASMGVFADTAQRPADAGHHDGDGALQTE